MTDTDLARQLIAYVDATTDPVANPIARRNGQAVPQTATETETIMLTEERTESTSKRRPIGWLVLAAAAVALIVVGFVITASGSDEEPAPADQPAPTTAVTTIPDDDPSGQSSALAANAAIGDEFMSAFAALDAEAAAELFSADATGEFGTNREELDASFRFMAANGFRVESENCRAFEGGNVTCTLTQANRWSDAVEADPVRARVSMAVANGEITGLEHVADPSWTVVFGPFVDYILENHRNDAASMWRLDPSGEYPDFGRVGWGSGAHDPDVDADLLGGLILDDRSIGLFDRYSKEYLEAMTADS